MFLTYITLLNSVFEFMLGLAFAVLLYQIFVSDWIRNRKLSRLQKEEVADKIDNLARLQLISEDAKGIENFIKDNAAVLSSGMVHELIERIEALKNDSVISTDNLLKKRIDALQQPQVVPDDVVVEQTMHSKG